MHVMAVHRPYIRSFDGFGRPWNHLEEFVEGLTVTQFAYGTGYVAVGRVPSAKPERVGLIHQAGWAADEWRLPGCWHTVSNWQLRRRSLER